MVGVDVHRGSRAPRSWAAAMPGYMAVRDVEGPGIDEKGRGAGEREAIALAIQEGLHVVLMDDRRGYAAAGRLGLEPVSTLGVFMRAAELGQTDLARAFEALERTNFFWPPGLKETLLAAAVRSG